VAQWLERRAQRSVCFVYSRLSNFSAIRRLSPLPVTGLQFRPMLGAQGLWAGRDLYRATSTATRDLSLYGLIRKTGTHVPQWDLNPQPKDHQTNKQTNKIWEIMKLILLVLVCRFIFSCFWSVWIDHCISLACPSNINTFLLLFSTNSYQGTSINPVDRYPLPRPMHCSHTVTKDHWLFLKNVN
jgi:hypothetical protein